MYEIIHSTHDGHFNYVPDIVGSIFAFRRPMPLVSVSEGGQKLPSIFAYADVVDEMTGLIDYTPSSIATIDEEDAYAWLLNYSQVGQSQDRDALWNTVFFSLAQAALGDNGIPLGTFAGSSFGSVRFPGATTTLEFANGSTRLLHNYAAALVNLQGVETGEDLYEKFMTAQSLEDALARYTDAAPKPASTPTASTTAPSDALVRGTPWPGYPTAIARHSEGLVAGYNIPDDHYRDVAVLAIPSFDGLGSEFQQVVQQFLAHARAAGKTKLIVDLQANGGGTVPYGYDVFKQLFPQKEPWGWTRVRAHPAANVLGDTFSAYEGTHPNVLGGNLHELNYTTQLIAGSPYNSHNDMDQSGHHFTSWSQKYGPHEHHGDEFSSIIRWDFRDPDTSLLNGGIVMTGYQNRTGFTQPFAAEDIVLLYDGYCASTCTIFSQLMRQQGEVEAIALGGRPTPGLPQIQAVGGTKGANKYTLSVLRQCMLSIQQLASWTQIEKWTKILTPYWSPRVLIRTGLNVNEASVNVRDALDKGDPQQIPEQFKYELADCRVLYTPEMTVDAAAIWKAAADSKWGGQSHCVAGSVGGCDAIRGDLRTHG